MAEEGAIPIGPAQVDTAVEALDLTRNGRARTRAEIARASGLGRNIVTQRIASELLQDREPGPAAGGRPPSSGQDGWPWRGS